MVLGFSESTISISAVCNMFLQTAHICSSIAFAYEFLMLVGLHLMPNVLQGAWKQCQSSHHVIVLLYQQLQNQVIYITKRQNILFLLCVDSDEKKPSQRR
jgi:hypothetical protein